MKTKLIILFFILCLSTTKAQNLVLNPSFEQHSQCPTQYSEISYCNNWYDGALNSTCDYFSALGCSNNFSPPTIKFNGSLTWYQQPLSGKSFAGFIPYYGGPSGSPAYTEFLQGKLNLTLILNKLYYVEFYINSIPQPKYFIHDIAALITDTAGLVDHSNLQGYNPQILPMPNKIYRDTTNWMRINGYYTAHGGESYITIGNYTPYGQETKDSIILSGANEAYYFIDSVGVYEVTHLDAWDAGPNKTINYGDSVQIGNPCSDYSIFSWVTSTNGTTYLSDSTMPQIYSKPPVTTTYYVTKTQGTNIFKDTVIITVLGGVGIEQIKNITVEVSVYPNPATNKINVGAKAIVEVKLFDVLGHQILSTKQKEIDVSSLQNGVYFVSVKTTNGASTQKIIVQH